MLDITDLFLTFRYGYWGPKSSLARDPLGGVLFVRDILCLLTTISFDSDAQSDVAQSDSCDCHLSLTGLATPLSGRGKLLQGWTGRSCLAQKFPHVGEVLLC